MKSLFFAAALLISGAAIAQDTAAPDTAAQDTVAPANTDPERDSRGIAVISDPAVAPAGANQPAPAGPAVPAPNQAAAFATQPSTGEKPPCSRTVTDSCTQTYERGAGRPN